MPRRLLIAAWLIAAAAACASAQEVSVPAAVYPALPRTAPDAAGFAPPGWALEAQASGDLNRDGSDDLVMVFRERNPRNILDNQGFGPSPFDTNPRILAVAFAGGAGQPFRLALENHTLITRHETPTLDDAFDKDDGPTVRRGAFTVTLGLFANAGGWDMARITFTFRYRDARFELIGYDRSTVTRNTGATRDVSVNLLTGRVRTETGSIESDVGKVRLSRLPKGAAPTIEQVGDGMEFEPAGLNR
ncbi:MAG TPA: hypothetical protein VLA00_15300 [Xanthobacteraceae bacterium]|nr:hypothetical protein [Xanthobacteraceae bacterium]